MRKISKSGIVQYLLIYIMLHFHGTVLFSHYQDQAYIVVLVIAILLVLLRRGKITPYFRDVLILAGSMFLTYLTSGGSLSIPSIFSAMARLLLPYIAYKYDEKKFCDRFVNLVSFLAIVSLLFFAIQSINKNILLAILPAMQKQSATAEYHGLFLYTMTETGNRNLGIFSEPGLYQIILNAALYIMLFCNKKLHLTPRQNKIYLVAIVAAIVTAQSTTGYISLIILLFFYWTKKSNKETKEATRKFIIAGAILILIIVDLQRGDNSLIYKNLIVKLFNESGSIDLTNNTGNSRLLSIQFDMSLFRQYPLGAGFAIHEQLWKSGYNILSRETSSCVGITKSLATVGIISTGFNLYIYIKNLLNNEKEIRAILAYILMFVNLVFAQPSIQFPALIVLTLISNISESKHEVNDA